MASRSRQRGLSTWTLPPWGLGQIPFPSKSSPGLSSRMGLYVSRCLMPPMQALDLYLSCLDSQLALQVRSAGLDWE